MIFKGSFELGIHQSQFHLDQRKYTKTSLAPIKIWYQKWGQSYVCANIQQKDMYFLND